MIARLFATLALIPLLAGCGSMVQTGRAAAVPAALDLPPMKQFSGQTPAPVALSNTQVARDFLDLFFALENGVTLDRFTRFEGPVTVKVAAAADHPTLSGELDTLLRRLRREAGVDITRVAPQAPANIVIEVVPATALARRAPNTACIVAPNVSSWSAYTAARRGALSWTQVTRRERLAIFLPTGVSPQEVRDCLHEELAQALGPLNDLYRLTASVYNDDNLQSVLTPFDMLVLRAAYAPELRSGMSRSEVAARLPAILDRLNPAGQGMGAAPQAPTPRGWIDDVELAMSAAPVAARRAAAARAVARAEAEAWGDNRTGFAYFLAGRLMLGQSPLQARGLLERAYALYARDPATAIHAAHVAMQLSALALSQQDYTRAQDLAARAIPAAEAAQNATLLASLQLTQAEALAALGRLGEARAVRLDSLGWARYGFGSDRAVRARVAEIAALAR